MSAAEEGAGIWRSQCRERPFRGGEMKRERNAASRGGEPDAGVMKTWARVDSKSFCLFRVFGRVPSGSFESLKMTLQKASVIVACQCLF